MIINGIEYRKIDNWYYISKTGDVYSMYIQRNLKHSIDCDGYHRVDIHGKHKKIHRLVYKYWKGKIPNGKQVNHIDDDKNNNDITNLYIGTQKENIHDCIRNKHRKGHIYKLTVYDRKEQREISFCPAHMFFEYSGHSSLSKSLKKCFKTKWFNDRYDIIDFSKGVTTTENKSNDQ